ncbi:MAG: metallophosphoesterase [Clostridia bacterium]|nr:metallophosphoesterase [Clostridia bacterium]
MYSTLATVLYKLLTAFLSFSLILSPAAVPAADDPVVPDGDASLVAVLWSDTHASDYLYSRNKNIRAAVTDLAAAKGVDALVIDGDLTENGKLSEYRWLADELSRLNNVPHVLPATGNHDIRLRNFNTTVETFSSFCETVNPALKLDKLYYSYVVNGYTFIVLGSTETVFEEAAISDGEFSFLDAALAKGTSDGKPVFVFLHQPLKNGHGLPDSWGSPLPYAGSVGKDSERLSYILNKYENVFLITGHLHSGLGDANFEEVGKVHCLNLPSIGIVSKDGGFEAAGCGYVMEVTGSAVTFRARDFASGRYMPQLDRTVALVK